MHTASTAHTKKIAADLAKEFLSQMSGRKKALVVGLVGDLGAGKTTFTQGFARGLGIKGLIPSPTFVLMRRYEIPSTNDSRLTTYDSLSLVHIDAYRIKTIFELRPLRFKELLADPTNLILIEWADIIRNALPKDTRWIHFLHGELEGERKIQVQN